MAEKSVSSVTSVDKNLRLTLFFTPGCGKKSQGSPGGRN